MVVHRQTQRRPFRQPRPAWLDGRQEQPRVHFAHAAELNSFEAFAPFAAGVILAQLAGVPADRVALLAVTFVAFRLLHGIVYITGRYSSLRSLLWTAAFFCVLALLALAAKQVA